MAEPVISLLKTDSIYYSVKTTTENLVAQSIHDIIVIPFQEQDIVLNNETQPSHYLLSFFLLLTQDGWTTLMVASQNGHTSVVEKLLAAGADPNHQDKVRKKLGY